MQGLEDFASEASAAAPAVVGPQDSAVASWLSGSQEDGKLGLSVSLGAKKSPDEAARVLRLAGATGLPQDLIERNTDEIEQKAKAADFDAAKFRASAPIVSQWLSEHPNNAAAAGDDMASLGTIERHIRNVAEQYKRGVMTVELAKIGEQKMLGLTPNSDVFGEPSLDEKQAYYEKQLAQSPDFGITGFFAGIPGAISNQLPMFKASFMGKVKAAIAGGAGGAAVGAGTAALAAAPEAAATGPAAPAVEAVGVGAGALAGGETGATLGWKYGAAVQDARIFGGLSYLDFEKMKDVDGNKLDRDTVLGASTIVGTINGALGMIPFEETLRNIPGLRSLSQGGVKELLETPTARAAFMTYAQHVGQASALGGGVGFTQSMVQSTAGELAMMVKDGSIYKLSPGAILSRVFSDENLSKASANARMGVQAAGGTSAAMGTTALMTDMNRARVAQANSEAIKSAGDTLGSTKLFQNLPEGTKQLVARIAQNGADKLYAPVDSWNQYWQSKNVDPREVASQVTGSPASYDEAVRAGTDMPIKTEDYATTLGAVPEHNAFFASELRTDPTAMNAREAGEFVRSMEKTAGGGTVAAPDEIRQSSVKVEQDIEEKLKAAHYSPDAAAAQSKLYGKAFENLGRRAGLDPWELYQQYGLSINRELPNAVKEKGIDGLDPILDRLRTEKVPSESEAMGPDILDFLRKEGGIKPENEGSDIAALEPDENLKPFQRKLINPEGMSADEAAQRAHSSGYLSERDIPQLVDKIDSTLRGEPAYSTQNTNAGRLEEINQLREMDAFLSKSGIDLSKLDNPAVKKILAEMSANERPAEKPEESFFQAAVRKVKEAFGVKAPGQESAPGQGPVQSGGPGQEAAALRNGETIGLPSRLPDEVSSYPKSVTDNLKNFKALFGEQPLEGTAEILRQELAAKAARGQSQDQAILERLTELDNTTKAIVDGKDELAGWPAKAKQRLLESLDREISRRVMLTGEAPEKGVADLHEQLRQDLGGQTFEQPAKAKEITQTPAFKSWFGESKVVDENGEPKEVYHGTQRPDRIGNRFRKARATSGPMAFFTDSPELGSSYSTKKSDTSIENTDYDGWYKFKPKGSRVAVDISSAWWHLSAEQREKIARLAPRVSNDDEGNIILRPEGESGGLGGYDQHIKEAHGNHLKALVEEWLSSGALYNREEEFGKVLELAGMDGAKYDSPYAEKSGVIPVYLSIKNPLDTSNLSPEIIEALQKRANRQRPIPAEEPGGDLWDKSRRDPQEWMSELKKDQAAGKNSFVWSSIPDWVTDELKKQGYDGIKDIGGKGGGEEHHVWIPFEENQVKSSIGNSGEFNPRSKNILEQAAPGGEDSRGRIRIGAGRQMNIDLLKQADLSTFLHETGHFYMEVLGDLAQRSDAKDDIKNDYKTLLDYAGADSREGLTREGHEKIARSFEAYLMEGKAPTPELRGAFSKMRAWLIGVYRQAKALNVELTPQVRGVFDRLLAGNDELEAAKAEQGVKPLFSDPRAIGMSETEAEKYRAAVEEAQTAAEEQISGKMMAEVRREQLAWWKERRAAVRGQIEGQVSEQPEYIARAVLGTGKMPDGSDLPEGVTPFKIDKKSLVDAYGKEFLKRLPRPFVYTSEGGVHFDRAAEALGFRSGDELVMALANSQNPKQLIEAKTDAAMRETYGDMMTDGSLQVEAMKAVHTEKRSELLQKELKYLAENKLGTLKSLVRKVTRRMAPLEDVRAQAEEDISRKAPRDISPSLYQRAEARSGREAVDALLRGDVEGAFEAKQRELLNHELYRAAAGAREEIDKMVDYASRFDDKATRQRVAKAGSDYLGQIDNLLDRYDFRTSISLKAIDSRQSLLDWVAEQHAQGRDVGVPQELLDEAAKKHYKDVPLEELRGVMDTVKTIEHLARTKNDLLANQRARDMESAREEIRADIEAHHEIKAEPPQFAPTLKDKFLDKTREIVAAHTRMEFLFEHLGGNEPHGPTWEIMFKPFTEGENEENQMLADSAKSLSDIFERYDKGERARWYLDRKFIPEINANMTFANRLALALNMGNAYNKDAVLRGYGWSESQAQAVLKTLTAKDWRTAQMVWDHVNSFWPKVEEMEKKLNGIAPQKVEATPFSVVAADGETVHLDGGYYPIVFDKKLSWRQSLLEAKENVKDMFGGSWARAMTRHGHTEERTNTGGKPVLLQLTGLTNHLNGVIHDLAFRERVIDAHRMINDAEIRSMIEGAAGKEMYRQLNPWIASIASDRAGDFSNPIEGLLSSARGGATIVNLGLKVTTALVHALGYNLAAKELGAGYALSGLRDVWAKPWNLKSNWDFVTERSQMMRDYPESSDRDVRDAMRHMNVAGVSSGPMGAVDVYTGNVRHAFLSYITYANLASALPAWMGAYRKAMDGGLENIEKGDEKSAIEYADSLVRRTKGSNAAKDLAGIQSGSQSFRLFTMFYSQMTLVFNHFQKDFEQFRMDRNVPKLLGATAMTWFLPAVMDEAIRGHSPKDNEDDESKMAWWGRKIMLYPAKSMILARDVAHAADQYIETGKKDFSMSPVADVFQTAAGGLALPFKAMGDKPLKRSDYADAFNTMGYITKLPTRQTWMTAEYLYDWMTGAENPSSPLEGFWRAAAVGKPKKP